MAISINIDGNSYELNGLDHPAEEETARKLLTLMEKYAKEDKDLQTKLLKEFKDQLTKLNKEVNTLATATTKPATAPAAAANRPANNNNAPTSAAAKALNNAAGAANNNSKVINNLTTSAGFATGAVNSMAEGLKEGTSAFTGVLGIAGGALKAVGAAAGFAVTSLVGLGVASLSAFMEASKFQGDLAKGGMRFTDSLTSLNSSSYRAGMTMEQMTSVVKGSSQAISQLGRGGTNGAARFAQLVAAARNSTESLRGFGFTAQEEAQARADYLDILRLQGNSETARTMTNGQIITQSNKMVKGFMGVAAASGKTIDELIKKTKEIAGTDDFGLTVESLGLTAEQSTRLAKNLAVLDAQGLGSLKQVFLEMKTFGTSIGDTGIDLKTLGIGSQVEGFLNRLDKLEPDQVQGELVKFAKTLPTQAIAEFATKAQMVGGPAAAVANELRRLSKLSKEDLDAMAREAQQKNAALEQAKRLEDDTNKLKGMINNVLLRIAESPGFQRILGQLMYALETYGPQISDSIANIAVGIYEYASKLFTPQGRQGIINDIATAFSEILIGIKKAVLGPLGMYSAEQEKAERAVRVATNDRLMAETLAISNDRTIQSKQVELNKLRIQYGEALLKGDETALAAVRARMDTVSQDIDNRKKALTESNPIAAKAAEKEKKAEEAASKFTNSNYKLAGVAAAFVIGLWGAKKLIVAGLEALLLGKDMTRSGGLLGKLFGGAGAGPAGATKGADGRYRDAAGKFTKAPVEAPTTAKGVGLGMMSDMSKQFTQALGWVLKAGAIAGAMYMIGKAMPVLAEGAKSFDGVDWESMAKAGTAITGISIALYALGKVPLGQMLQGLAGAAVVSGAMVILAFGFSQLVPQLEAFQKLDWETMGKAAATLVGLIAIGAGAGVLAEVLIPGALALGALGLALRAFPIDVLEALGKLFETVGATIGGIVTKIAEGVGLIVDKIAALRNSGIEATTAQIERLSQIPSAQLFSAAEGVKALKLALDGFGGGFFDNIGRGITSFFGADQASQVERMASAMERYKRSVSVLSDNGAGEFVLKPIDIGLYTQLQQTLDLTKAQINTTFSKKTYEETFVGTTKAIDATYNVKTSKLDKTLEATREAIKAAFKPPYAELTALTQAIKDAVSNATSGLTVGGGGGGGGYDRASFLAKTKELESVGGKFLRPIGNLGNTNTIGGAYHMSDAARSEAFNNLDAAGRLRLGKAGFVFNAPKINDIVSGQGKDAKFKDGMEEIDRILAESLADLKHKQLSKKLGRNATNADMRGAWHLGDTGYLKLLRSDPNAKMSDVFSELGTDGVKQFHGMSVGQFTNKLSSIMGSSPIERIGGGKLGSADATLMTSGGTLATGSGFKQLFRGEDGKLVDAAGKKASDGTLTTVSNEADTQGKMLNLLEQTYNLHADHYYGVKQDRRFKGFTQG